MEIRKGGKKYNLPTKKKREKDHLIGKTFLKLNLVSDMI